MQENRAMTAEEKVKKIKGLKFDIEICEKMRREGEEGLEPIIEDYRKKLQTIEAAQVVESSASAPEPLEMSEPEVEVKKEVELKKEVEEVMEEVPVAPPVYDLDKNIVAGCISRLNATANIYQALDHYQKGNFLRAISAAKKCVRNEVEVNLAHYIMALSYQARHNPHAATACLQKIPVDANPSEVLVELDFHANPENWDAKVNNLQRMISDITLSHDGASDIQRALKHFRKKNFIKAMSLAKASIRDGVETSFAHLLIAMSLYHCEDKNRTQILAHLNLAETNLAPESDSHMEKFAHKWAGSLKAALNIKLEDVIECIVLGSNENLVMRDALEGLVKFEALEPHIQIDSKLDRYTQYKIIQGLHADKKIASKDYVNSLKSLAIKESDNPSLYKKVERQITRHNTNIVRRAGSYGAHLARNFFKAARDKYYVNAFVKFADEMRKQKINSIGDVAFHVIPHAIPLIVDLLVYAAYSVASAVRWLVSPFIGYSSAKASEVKPDRQAADAALPVVNKQAETKAFKFHHVKHGAGLGFFANAIKQNMQPSVVSPSHEGAPRLDQ